MVVHRLAEVGGQADGVTGKIATRLVADVDTHICFRQGDSADPDDVVPRFQIPAACDQPGPASQPDSLPGPVRGAARDAVTGCGTSATPTSRCGARTELGLVQFRPPADWPVRSPHYLKQVGPRADGDT